MANLSQPAQRMSWRLGADIRPADLEMSRGQVILPLALLAGDRVSNRSMLAENQRR